MGTTDVLRLVVVLWFLAAGIAALLRERRAAREADRPMRRRVVVLDVVGLALVVLALVLLGLDAAGLMP